MYNKLGRPGKNTITLVSSIASRLIAIEQPVGYHVVKAGLEQMTRYYALVLGTKGIRVNAVAPNMILKEENKGFYLRNKNLYDLNAKVSPLGKMINAQDIASTIIFFCSLDSASITGQTLVVDGGISLQEHAGLGRRLLSLDGVQITQKNHNLIGVESKR